MKNKILLYNGNIYAMVNGEERYNAILLNGDTIEAVGDSLAPTEEYQCIDLDGKTVLPGFSDCHVHFFQTGLKRMFVDCTRLSSISEIQERAAFLKDKYSFVPGWGFNPEAVAEKRALTRSDLDAVSTVLPIYIRRVDGHSSYLNSAAIKMVEPLLHKMTGASRLNEGVVTAETHEFADLFFLRLTDKDTLTEAAKYVEKEALSKGATCIHALTPFREWTEVLLEIMDGLSITLVPFCRTMNVAEVIEMGMSRIGGCLLIDGSFGSRSAALFEPYSDDPGNRGNLYFSDEEVIKYMREANNAGLQLTMHAIGPRGIEQYLRCIEKVIGKVEGNRYRHRLEHCELPTEAQIKKIHELGIILSMQPAFEYYWGGPSGMYYEALGGRWRKTNPFKRIVSEEITVIGGSDSYVTPIDPLLGVHSAVNHPNPEERVSVYQALQFFTKNPAHAAFSESEYGVLRKGMKVDLAILESDPFSINPSMIKDINIFATVMDGKLHSEKDFY
ncbi:amidohydrolase [bacterium]|nr:amidohydrolase [bacterium]